MRRTAFFATLIAAGAVVATAAYAAQPQSAAAQRQAERDCVEQGVQPRSSAWELCLSHVTRAYEWGEPSLAGQLARAAGDGQVNCLQRGRPETAGYRACLAREIDARSELLILGDDQSGVNVAEAQ